MLVMAAGPGHAADFDDADDGLSPSACPWAGFCDGAAMSSARNDQAIFEKLPLSSTHGRAVSPSKTTIGNGKSLSLAGGTGCTLAGILTVTVLLERLASGSASRTVTDQIGWPVSGSICCTLFSLVDRS